MTNEQIQMLRQLIRSEVECASIDGMEHGAWGWAERQLDEGWKEFQQSFVTLDEEEISEEENDKRFKECIKVINNFKPGDLTKLMGKEFIEEFKRVSQH